MASGRPMQGRAVHRSSVWSTQVDLMVSDAGAIVPAVRILNHTLQLVDSVASRFRADSEINELQRSSAGEPWPVSADLLEAMTIAQRAAALTDGAVDPTVGTAISRLGYDRDFSIMAPHLEGELPDPGPVPGWRSIVVDTERSTVSVPAGVVVDLGATAKAWAADRAAGSIATRLGLGVLVSLGGDITVAGPALAGGFAVGIADVCGDPDAPQTVTIDSGGLATSGIGRRRWTLGGHPVHHLIDPGTGLPVSSPWKTVSVAAGSCVDANIASTAAMIMGSDAPSWLEHRGLPARMVGHQGDVTTVAGWPAERLSGVGAGW
jgi:thiamine biosynthesis lipoprotein ApbE